MTSNPNNLFAGLEQVLSHTKKHIKHRITKTIFHENHKIKTSFESPWGFTLFILISAESCL